MEGIHVTDMILSKSQQNVYERSLTGKKFINKLEITLKLLLILVNLSVSM